MKWFEIYGEYGPQACDYVERAILAKNKERALKIFENFAIDMIGEYAYKNLMGPSNIYCKEL